MNSELGFADEDMDKGGYIIYNNEGYPAVGYFEGDKPKIFTSEREAWKRIAHSIICRCYDFINGKIEDPSDVSWDETIVEYVEVDKDGVYYNEFGIVWPQYEENERTSA